MDAAFLLILLVPILLVVGACAALIIHLAGRARYREAVRAQGWAIDENPGEACLAGLNAPPFGLGLRRRAVRTVHGRVGAGVPFQVIDYAWEGGREQVACLRLRDVHTTRAIPGTTIAVDGRWLTARGCPSDPAAMRPFLDGLLPHLARIEAEAPDPTQPVPEGMSFAERPDVIYQGRDDSVLSWMPHDRGGFDHEAHDLVSVPVGDLWLVTARHEWCTRRTVTETDGQGRTTTRTETDHHSETLCSLRWPWRMPPLVITNGGALGVRDRCHFESVDFDARFVVGCADKKFASDVIHPRMMDFLLATNPPPMTMSAGGLTLRLGSYDLATCLWAAACVAGFLDRIPDFVWADLGVRPAPEFGAADVH